MAKFPTLYGSGEDDVLYGLGEDDTLYIDQETKPRIIRAKKRETMPILSRESRALMKVELSPKGRRLGLKVETDGIYTSSGMKICGRFLVC